MRDIESAGSGEVMGMRITRFLRRPLILREARISLFGKRVISSLIGLTGVLLLSAACSGCGDQQTFEQPKNLPVEEGFVTLEMGGVGVLLEVAATDEKRALGLMRRTYLKDNQGMIFIYPEPKIMRFYMRDTRIPLSIAFIKDDGIVINIEKMRPNTERPSHLSKGYCRFAIEMTQGWFKKHGIQAGDRITLTPELLNMDVN